MHKIIMASLASSKRDNAVEAPIKGPLAVLGINGRVRELATSFPGSLSPGVEKLERQ